MASTTTNYGLTKPAYSDTADIATQNTNMDKIDTALGGLDAGIAIVANGNTHAAISEGQYVYIRGHNSLAEGLYRATANIAANGTLSGTNVTSAVMGTALAALSGSTVKYTDVINNLTSSETSKPLSAAQGKSLSDQIANVQKGTYYLPNSHCVYAGRNGWGGLNIRTIIPINKGTSGISSATINLSGATVYACTANGVYDITSNISSISCYFSGTGILTAVAVTIVLSSNPLPFNDGIVNISINGGTPTITFA